jgi:hypothetical protein
VSSLPARARGLAPARSGWLPNNQGNLASRISGIARIRALGEEEMNWYPYACPTCAGALHDDGRDSRYVECIMCGRTYAIMEILVSNETRRQSIRVRPLEMSGEVARRQLQEARP